MATRRRCTRFLHQRFHQTLETSRASAKAPSPTPSASSRLVTATVRTPSSYVPTQHGLSVHASTEVPLVPMFRPCRLCGATSHTLADCPIMYYSDSNTNHQVEWESSTVGMAWAAVGYSEWQLNLVLPGYEERVQLYSFSFLSGLQYFAKFSWAK